MTYDLRLSDEEIIRSKYFLDLGEWGDGILKRCGEIEIDDETKEVIKTILYLDEYNYKGWKFSDVKVEFFVYPYEIPFKDGYLDDYIVGDDFTIEPTEDTEILKRGDEKDLYNTTFEEYLLKQKK